MNAVVIKCPKTKQLVPTGIDLNPAQFLLMEPTPRTLRCPACREVHTWDKQDARLTDS
jgi:phage FluMu protein Com